MKDRIESTLLDIWSSAGTRGYWCVVESIDYVIDKAAPWNVTKDVYPEVGRRLGTNARNVEKNMRYYIESVWKFADREKLNTIFGDRKFKPGNKEFLSVLARRIRMAHTNSM